MPWAGGPAVRSFRPMPSQRPHCFTFPTVREIRPVTGSAESRPAAPARRLPATCLHQRDRVAASLLRVSPREPRR
jgi:hypothetical protein